MKSVITANVGARAVSKTYPFLPWIVCFTAALFFFFEFMQVNIFNALTPSLMKEFSLSAARVGQISANYFYATMLFVFPAGMILDRCSTRKVILWAMGSSILSTFIFAMAQDIWVAQLCRFITGVGGSFCLISCIRLASRWFPPRRLALVIGLIVTIAMCGGMLAQTPLTLLTDKFGWRNMLSIDASLGLIMLMLIFIFVKDQPTSSTTKATFPPTFSTVDFKTSLSQSLLNSQNWLGGLYTSLLNLPILLMGALWGNLYLVQAHSLTRTQSSFVISMLFIGTIIGSPCLGWCSDRIGLRRLPMIVSAILSLAVILMVMLIAHLSLICLLTLFFALGFFTSAQIISYPLIAESNSKALTGTAEGIASTLIMAGGATQPLFGLLMSMNWDHTIIDQIPFYSPDNYFTAMMMIPVAFVLALLAAWFVKETYCKPLD